MKFLLAGIIAVALTVGWSPGITHADVVTANIQGDDSFDFYLSTSDAIQGTLIGSGLNYWQNYNFSNVSLTPDVTNYIHIVGYNSGGATGITANFILSTPAFYFANGTQSLTTNLTNWTASAVGFGQNVGTPVQRESGIWQNDPDYWNHPSYAYLSAPIYSTPEPSTYALLCISLGVVGFARKKMRKSEA